MTEASYLRKMQWLANQSKPPRKMYGRVRYVRSGYAYVIIDDAPEEMDGVIARNDLSASAGSRVRVLWWPDDDTYIDAILT